MYQTVKGKGSKIESSLSKNPPWPGKIVPESYIQNLGGKIYFNIGASLHKAFN